ncbi:MAG: rod shape-determining protein RodA [Burkholderiaceae bacterium]|nr:rod shape-determining protein RodA [Burkholderiaceae bacterium]
MQPRPLLIRLKPYFSVLDGPLLFILGLLACSGLVVMYSSAFDFPGRFADHLRNYMIALVVMWLIANISPQTLMRIAVPLYVVGVLLLIGVALGGEVRKGARRWLNLGFTTVQPSEIMKIAMPLMLAWYFHKYEAVLKFKDFIVASVLLIVPVALIARQPDLGTAILILLAGLFVLFFAGLSWKLIIPVILAGMIGITTLVAMEEKICQPDVDWKILHDYQKNRVCTQLNPMHDPLGKGFHTIQSAIAIGSGGLAGKGLMQGTQTHLEFIPERTTDFILAVYAEEFGLLGIIWLVILYIALVFRGLMIAGNAPNTFTRLLAGSVTLIFFTYAFVNMGMVAGMLPVVGVPLPFMSYGGTALLTLGLGCGILMSVQRHKAFIAR